MAVKLVIDSSSDIDNQEANKLGITMLPISINFGENEFMDGVDLTREQFYDKLVKCTELPKTSMINEYRFSEAFKEIIENGDEIVAIVLSSGLSGTYNAAKAAADNFNDKVFVVDSLNASGGVKVLIDYALKLVEEGKSAKEIFDLLEEKRQKIHIIAMVDTLKYLKKGGRISPLVAFAGELMGIKPIVSLINGKVELIGKAIGLRKAIHFINGEIEKFGGIDFNMPFYAIYSGNDQEKVNNYINNNAQLWECKTEDVNKNHIGATIGTHIGPGAIGVVFFSK